MPSPEDKTEAEAEMTPEARQIIGKARRSFGFSIAVLLLGFIAIVFALVYRSMRDSEPADMRYPLSQISVPAGAEVVSVVPGTDRLAVTYRAEGKTSVRLIDPQSGEIIQDLPVVSE